MSSTRITTTELATSAESVNPSTSGNTDAIEYPERRWTAPSVWHGTAVGMAANALHEHFRQREDVLVAMELVVYYVRGDNTTWLQPDVQVVFGVEDRRANRSTFNVWEEGKAPDFVLEVASPSTGGKDAGRNARQYARMGVREYWRLDPTGSLPKPLEGYVASGGRYVPVEAVEDGSGSGYLRSRVLGLDLRAKQWLDGATVLAFRELKTREEFDSAWTRVEQQCQIAERGRRVAENQARREADLRRAAEQQATTAEKQTRC